MSNIYDALSKRKGARPQAREQGAPAGPPGSSIPADLPVLDDPERNIELEALRQRILLEVTPDKAAAVVLTSAVPGEGSTTLSLLLAQELASHGRGSVLLVDADLEGGEGSLTGSLQTAGVPGPGLADLLAGRGELPSCVLATEQSGLHFLPRGAMTSPVLELVKPERVQRVFRQLTQSYPFVLVDTGASLHAVEAPILAAAADGVILVVRTNRTRREVVQKAAHLLNKARCRLLGIVLNDRRYPVPEFLYRRL